VDRGQRRREQGTEMHVVKAGDGDVGRHPDPGRVQLAHRPDRHLVIAADDGVGQFAARRGE